MQNGYKEEVVIIMIGSMYLQSKSHMSIELTSREYKAKTYDMEILNGDALFPSKIENIIKDIEGMIGITGVTKVVIKTTVQTESFKEVKKLS